MLSFTKNKVSFNSVLLALRIAKILSLVAAAMFYVSVSFLKKLAIKSFPYEIHRTSFG
jgi:hypothetical protein